MSLQLTTLLNGERRVWPLEGETLTVGRSSKHALHLPDATVSKDHAEIVRKDEQWSVKDLGSRNGTRLNQAPVVGSIDLKTGDVVGIGENSLALRQVRAAEAQNTDMIDTGAGGQVKRFGRGVDIKEAVMLARDIKESSVLRALDNFAPFDLPGPPVAGASDTDESNPHGEDGAKVAVQ